MSFWRKDYLKNLIQKLKKLFNRKRKGLFYIGGSDVLPPPLSKDEESDLLEKYAKGDMSARSILIERNLRLVVYIAKKFESAGMNVEDLISIGTIGLIKAINTFKLDKNIKLATYASRCIENEILMHFRNNKKYAQDVYISDPIDTDKNGNTLTLIDIIADEDNIEEKIDTKIKLQRLREILNTALDEREMQIISMRYGLNGNNELTQREIAKKLKISRSYVSRIETAALQKMKKMF